MTERQSSTISTTTLTTAGSSSTSPPINSNLFSYFEQLPVDSVLELYGDSATCQAVFRNLPPLAQHFVMKMLFLTKAVKLETVWNWTIDDKFSKTKHELALQKLIDLHLCNKIEKQVKFTTTSE
jgi:hypothetical protein